MNFRDTNSWIFRALWMQRTRTLLTIVGFSIGIAAMVILSALGEGLRVFVLNEFTQFGSHIIAVNPGKTETFGLSGLLNTTRPLSLSDATAISQMPNVEEVVPLVMGNAKVKYHQRARYTDVAGVGGAADKAWKLEVAQGKFLPQDDLQRARALVVLGSKVKEELFAGVNPVGSFVRIGSERFRVVGVVAPKGEFLGTDLDDMVFIPAGKGMQLFNRQSLMEIDIFFNPRSTSEAMADKISQLLIERHGFEDFTLTTQDQVLVTMDNILSILTFAGAGLGAISLLVGAVGITTILMITVTERTGEVGLLRALGGTTRTVRLLFLGEALVLGLIGGVCGVLLVAFLLLLIHLFVPALPVALSPTIVLGALGISMLIGLLAGSQPAASAAKMTPIDALRAE
ncbi:Macrolide export ATP-binding/permease protein MacB [Gammaproteobacteria bacterium MOLA455]|nr:Macrolide export ATP-binding/permease protein MacB [Gammaproteobacteria bacterium MOLA455]